MRSKLLSVHRQAERLPTVVRWLAGLVLVFAGILGIVLPLLGFWMVPLGLLFIVQDFPPLRRRVDAWLQNDSSGPAV